MNEEEVPLEFYKSLAQDIGYPLACVTNDNKFIWVNSAFEKLVGYSVSELIGKTWMTITKYADVGADLANTDAIMSGKIDEYRMEKKYIHKRGHDINIELTVKRWPKSNIEPLVYFRVEACPAKSTKLELDTLHDELLTVIKDLQRRIELAEKKNNDKINIDFVGGNKSGGVQNSDQMIKYLTGALIFLGGVVCWLAYYVATIFNHTTPAPPQ